MTTEKTIINLELKREGDTGKSTYGILALNGTFRCYTLEDSTKNGYGKGCGIPPGKYRVMWEHSNRFKRETLRLKGVPRRDGILVHSGNSSSDCEGCILLGRNRASKDIISESRVAVSSLENWIAPKLQAGAECWITIEGAQKP